MYAKHVKTEAVLSEREIKSMSDEERLKVRDYIFAHYAGFALDGKKSGLTAIPGQTGSGKTYAAAALACAVAEGKPDILLNGKVPLESAVPSSLPKRLIYVTPLKKNRNAFVSEIKKVAEANSLPVDAIEREVYVVENNVDTAISSIAPRLDDDDLWPEPVRALKPFKEFEAAIRDYYVFVKAAEMSQGSPSDAARVRKQADDGLRLAESALRKGVKDYLKGLYNDSPDKRNGTPFSDFCLSSDFNWVRKVWPSASTHLKSVFVMTPEKFMRKHDTITHGAFTWCSARQEGGVLDGAVVILDESDTTYDNILRMLIDDAVGNGMDPIEFVQQLVPMAKDRWVGRDSRLVPPPGADGSLSKYSGFRRLMQACDGAAELYDRFHFSSNFKLAGCDGKRVQLFSDGLHSHARVNGQVAKLVSKNVPKDGKNWIVPAEGKKQEDQVNILSILHPTKGVSLAVLRALLESAYSFQALTLLKQPDGGNEGTSVGRETSNVFGLSLEEAISSVVEEYNIADKDRVKKLIGSMAQGYGGSKVKQGNHLMLTREDMSIYSQGVSLIDLSDRRDRTTKTEFSDMALLVTPEALLCGVATACKVILVSATSSIPQLHNFHLPYVVDVVGGMYEPEKEHVQGLLEANRRDKAECEPVYDVETRVYGQVNALDPECWGDICLETAIVAGEHKDEYGTDADSASHNANREHKIVRFVKDCIDLDIRSALIFNTASANKPEYDAGRISELCHPFIVEALRSADPEAAAADLDAEAASVLVALNSSTWAEGFAAVKEALAQGKRRYIVLSYQTAGAGMNPQYAVGDADKARIRPLPGCASTDLKDFEAVYLGRPTNIFVQDFTPLRSRTDDDELRANYLSGLWEQGVLYERGEQSYSSMCDRRDAIAQGYSSRSRVRFKNGKNEPELWDLPAVRGTMTKTINQAVGRITRTGVRTGKVLIGIDGALSGMIDAGLTTGLPTSREYDEVLNALHARVSDTVAAENIMRSLPLKAAMTNRQAVRLQFRQAYRPSANWSEAEIAHRRLQWETWLRFPTASKDEHKSMNPSIRRQSYIEMPEPMDSYWFRLDSGNDNANRWEACSFSFDIESPFGSETKLIDESMTRLPELMRSGIARSYFESHGYATEWEKGDYMIPAGMVKNGYMGALGEAAVRAWLEGCLGFREGVEFGDMPDGLFEMFDFAFNALRVPVYVDAKNWGEGTVTPNGYIDKVKDKLKDCGGGYALFMRALGHDDGGAGLRLVAGADGHVLEIPYLFDAETGEPNWKAAGELAIFLADLKDEEAE